MGRGHLADCSSVAMLNMPCGHIHVNMRTYIYIYIYQVRQHWVSQLWTCLNIRWEEGADRNSEIRPGLVDCLRRRRAP